MWRPTPAVRGPIGRVTCASARTRLGLRQPGHTPSLRVYTRYQGLPRRGFELQLALPPAAVRAGLARAALEGTRTVGRWVGRTVTGEVNWAWLLFA